MSIFRAFFIFLSISLIVSCGGGGGSDSSSLSNGACEAIGLPARSITEKSAERIINGEACGQLSRSPVVRLVMFDARDNTLGYCTGTMISKTDILTAAHCVVPGTDAVAVVYGDPGNQKVTSVSRIKLHPLYKSISQVGDAFAAFNDVAVYSIPQDIGLPSLPLGISQKVESGDVIDIYGYGTDEEGRLDFAELRSGEMLVSSVTDNHISSFYNGEGSNTCQGDSGGPALVSINGQAAVVGVTSSGSQVNCLEGDNSLFTNIQSAAALEFIRSAAPGAGQI